MTQLDISILNTAGEPQSHFGWRSPVSSSGLFSASPPVLFLKQLVSLFLPLQILRHSGAGLLLHAALHVRPTSLCSAVCMPMPATSDLCLLPKHLIRPFHILLLFNRPSSAKFNFLSCLLANASSPLKTQDWEFCALVSHRPSLSSH